jgi:uncharacterized membrane protein YidH (DUF202 family)
VANGPVVAKVGRPKPRGLAHERTALAWNRSGLAFVVCMAVLVRHLWPFRGAAEGAALALFAGSGMAWAAALAAFSVSGPHRVAGLRPRPIILGLMAAGTVLLAVVAFGLAFFAPS